jgi:hypothetical protein
VNFFGKPPNPAPPDLRSYRGAIPHTTYRTNSGRMLELADPETAQVDVEDIAHNLARICRFGGSMDGFYSVATHCVYVSRQLEAEGHSAYVQAAGLIHDAAEAYIGDVTSGLKRVLPEYKALEKRWERRIQDYFDVHLVPGSPVALAVKDADLRARLAEARDLFRETPYPREQLLGGEDGREPYEARCVEQTPDEAEWAWCARARELGLW